ncbi:hypothetical protein GTA08_BOTSDO06602 [Botryosphaeria dothidea]|uniref:Uncharacterized protein n=1 Tax=Botryosphaeria dothidea TaxID=55169 RepID=A0A8H4IP98_9PEZI|nr:hypothetical protein GTA08_BOTSDO06602 [Botryosphaeria dothidea]
MSDYVRLTYLEERMPETDAVEVGRLAKRVWHHFELFDEGLHPNAHQHDDLLLALFYRSEAKAAARERETAVRDTDAARWAYRTTRVALDHMRDQWYQIRGQFRNLEDRVLRARDWTRDLRELLESTADRIVGTENATSPLWLEVSTRVLGPGLEGDDGRRSPPPAYHDTV